MKMRFSMITSLFSSSALAMVPSTLPTNQLPKFSTSLYIRPPPGGVTVDSPKREFNGSSDIPPDQMSTTEGLPFQNRGKVNEIDFCMSPSDVSLSRLSSSGIDAGSPSQQPRILSLTRALNNASNRAVRRILLSRSWPSTEALNMSLRQVLASSGKEGDGENVATINDNIRVENLEKCPVPRPILNIIMRRSAEGESDEALPLSRAEGELANIKRGMTDEEWVKDQMMVFRESYGALPAYEYADAYLECILSLATTGVESPRVSEVIEGAVYDDSYRRVVSTLESVGTVFKTDPELNPPRMRIASKLVDQDICWSLIDKIEIKNNNFFRSNTTIVQGSVEPELEEKNETVMALKEENKTDMTIEKEIYENNAKIEEPGQVTSLGRKSKQKAEKLLLWLKLKKNKDNFKEESSTEELDTEAMEEVKVEEMEEVEEETKIKPEDLGGVLLSAEEPTMTRQLNVLSNIVKRALLFGGYQELLVLYETLEADKAAFINRWYPNSSGTDDDLKKENRPGVQYFNCLVQILKDCYNNGIITDLSPPLPLVSSYSNSYLRLTALLAELGSGYMNPARTKNILSAVPKTPTEEFLRFSQLEVALRRETSNDSDYPEDLIGSWQVKDEIGGKTIGTSTVVFRKEGEVYVEPPLIGLRWRLDPGPTHLDTCTFQVLSEDGAILQYRGFLDRGARIESRFSKRSVNIRGAVTFQMRDGESAMMGEEYKRDMLPISTETGTTRFVMSKVFDSVKE